MFVVLTFAAGPERGECLAVCEGDRLTIGRSSQAGRKVRDRHLSRIHLEVDFRRGGRALVRDLDSRNGVYVNGRRVEERVLGPHDRILAGQQVWDVSYVEDLTDLEDEAEETMTVLDQPKDCFKCGRPISLATFADGEVLEEDNRYLCPDCRVVVSFDSDVFQGFEILERLGSGSAGLVFKARQIVLGRLVALKVLRRRESLSPRTEARFLREAATIAKLDHPRIVKVFDASPFPEGYFIVMEYFEGADLQSLIEERGVPSVAVSLSIGLQMCEALDYAAGERIVHRDVKPANILYRARDGVAKLSDFGLAKRVGVSHGTRDGEGVGTPCYMPPEQLNDARNVDQRADVYSLGATLYHLLSGRYPIIASNLHEFMESILTRDPPPVEKLNPRVMPELAAVVRRAMRKKADERFQSARAFYEALDRVRQQYRIPSPPRVA
ncbi:MAG: FHA domain-containing protein [Planctomycetota bacterium]|nr:MAG: FHA domain-containing protein [Planctomycetota bacterium]